jgi:hypothetical protein
MASKIGISYGERRLNMERDIKRAHHQAKCFTAWGLDPDLPDAIACAQHMERFARPAYSREAA